MGKPLTFHSMPDANENRSAFDLEDEDQEVAAALEAAKNAPVTKEVKKTSGKAKAVVPQAGEPIFSTEEELYPFGKGTY